MNEFFAIIGIHIIIIYKLMQKKIRKNLKKLIIFILFIIFAENIKVLVLGKKNVFIIYYVVYNVYIGGP